MAVRKEIVMAWMMPYKLLKRFDGWGKVGADMVTVSFARDIVFDPFGELSGGEKPIKGADLRKDFVRKIAESTVYRHRQQAKGSLIMDKVTTFLGVVVILLALAIGLKVGLG